MVTLTSRHSREGNQASGKSAMWEGILLYSASNCAQEASASKLQLILVLSFQLHIAATSLHRLHQAVEHSCSTHNPAHDGSRCLPLYPCKSHLQGASKQCCLIGRICGTITEFEFNAASRIHAIMLQYLFNMRFARKVFDAEIISSHLPGFQCLTCTTQLTGLGESRILTRLLCVLTQA